MNSPGRQPPPPPGSAPASAASSDELRAWITKLEGQKESLGRRNLYLAVFLAIGVILLLVILWFLYQTGVRSYAALRDVQITRHPSSQGRVEVSFHVAAPGKVFFRRTSGDIETEVIDYFSETGDQQRTWSWIYQPGEDIHVSALYRGSFWRRSTKKSFPTAKRADIVVLIDTTGSMSRSIETLKEKCNQFSKALKEKRLEHRFALIGFGDTSDTEWCDKYEFTDDVTIFQSHVDGIDRFDGGDLPESSLDALETALQLSFDGEAIRRFYLVTDAEYHEPTQSGLTAQQLVDKLAEKRVLLNVFTREEFEPSYAKLAASSGKVQTIEDFGHVLSEGRILED